MHDNNLLREFLINVAADNKINPSHISIYTAILILWEESNKTNPLSIDRVDIMQLSKINSKVTYHKCLRYLNQAGYLKYKPSFSPLVRSQVQLITK
jgi:hypothetical protein